MADLNDFFAKKDRKKKKAQASKGKSSVTGDAGSVSVSAVREPGMHDAKSEVDVVTGDAPAGLEADAASASGPARAEAGEGKATEDTVEKVDDGWVDFDDPKTAHVNTGGRSIVKLTKDEAFERDMHSKSETQQESNFKGWAGPGWNTATGVPEESGEATNKFPSLAEAAALPKNATTVPTPQPGWGTAGAGRGPTGSRGAAGYGSSSQGAYGRSGYGGYGSSTYGDSRAAPRSDPTQRSQLPTANRFAHLKNLLDGVQSDNAGKSGTDSGSSGAAPPSGTVDAKST
uniref:Uncharacterized protein n=1 Tax=Erythrolobus australicus TaxID=1077150 RepID=A0A7S1XIN2_9RHOD|mmetsp:Transcript_3476/g.9510  ORF Transcript_3476/g.9510 Transcript_3476/m.9510 type:complete len:287 (+) Transcript_3476:117-977(+)